MNPLYHKLNADFIKAIISNKKASYRDDYDFFQGILDERYGKRFVIIISAENSDLKGFLYNLEKILITGCIISIRHYFQRGSIIFQGKYWRQLET